MIDFMVTLLNVKIHAVRMRGNKRESQKTPIFILKVTGGGVGLIIVSPHLKVRSPGQQQQCLAWNADAQAPS